MHTVDSAAIHPSEIIPPDWLVSEISLEAGALTVEHHVETASELSVSGFTHHVLGIALKSDSTRQITRFGKAEYDGGNMSGSFWLLAANDQPGFWSWDGTDEAIMFSIDSLQLKKIASELGYTQSSSIQLKNVTFGTDASLLWLAEQFKYEMQKQGMGSQLYNESLGTLLVTHLLREYSHELPSFQLNSSGLGNKRLKPVLDYIEAHLADRIELAQLAAIAGLSKYHFSEMFKRSTGLPPYRYVLIRRIEHAKSALSQSDSPINQIALMCGFSDQSHLTKHFRKSVGITPSAFRKQ